MKKALALILAVLMLLPSVIIITSAEDNQTAIRPKDVLGTSYTDEVVIDAIDTPPVLDGSIGATEYTSSRVIKPYDHLLPNESAEAYGEEYANVITEYFAHDANYIYYAYHILRDDTPTQGFVMFVPLENNYTLEALGLPSNRQLNASKALTITGSTGTACSVAADGAVAPVVGTDVAVNKVVGADNTTYTEIIISKQYLATARGVDKSEITSFEYSVYENWNYYAVPAGSSWGYITIDHKVTDAEAELLLAAGAETAPARAYNTIALEGIEVPDDPTIPNNYSYKFKDVDARNYVAGQVIDAAAVGEATAAPTMTGDKSEYQFSKTFYASDSSDPLTAYISVKDGYLYVAYETPEWVRMQFNVGIAASQRSDSIASFARLTWNGSHTGYTNQAPLIRNPGTGSNLGGLTTIGTTNFMVADVFSNGLQEAKFDLDRLYRLFAGAGTAGHGVYDSPCVTLAFWCVSTGVYYDVAESASVNVDSTETVTHVPATIIIPDESFAAIRAKMGTVGEKGTDHRNMLDGQLLRLEEYAEVAPTLDGVIDPTEYTGSIQDGTQTAYFAVKDGYLYMATSYAGNTYKSGDNFFTYLRYGLANHGEHMGLNGVAFAERETWSQYFAITSGTGAYATTGRNIGGWYTTPKFASTGYEPTAIVDRGVGCGDELVYEWKFSIATLAMIFEEMGWCADSANAFQFKLGQSVRDLSWKLSNQTNSDGTERLYTGLATGWLGTMLTVEFPEGCIEKYGRTEATTVDTNTTASTRLSPTNPGLRFKTNFYTQELYALVEQYGAANIKAGTLIAPTDTLGENKLTHEFGVAGVNYLDVPADLTIDPTTGYFANTFNGNNKLTTIAGSITNIKEKNLDRDFTGVGYIAYFDGAEWNYIYSNSVCERNVAYVAQAAVDAGEFEGNTAALAILERLGAVLPAPEEE